MKNLYIYNFIYLNHLFFKNKKSTFFINSETELYFFNSLLLILLFVNFISSFLIHFYDSYLFKILLFIAVYNYNLKLFVNLRFYYYLKENLLFLFISSYLIFFSSFKAVLVYSIL